MAIKQGNNDRIKVYIAKNGNAINQSMTEITTFHNDGHAVNIEAVLQGAVNDEFTILVNAVSSAGAITITSLNFTVHTL